MQSTKKCVRKLKLYHGMLFQMHEQKQSMYTGNMQGLKSFRLRPMFSVSSICLYVYIRNGSLLCVCVCRRARAHSNGLGVVSKPSETPQ